MAALTCIYKDEVQRTTHINQQSLKKVLWCAAAPEKLEWLFNNQRMRHAMASWKLPLLGSGSSPSEALHSNIHRVYRNVPEVHAETVQQQTDVFKTAGLLTQLRSIILRFDGCVSRI